MISFSDLLEIFWDSHSPTAIAYSRQYRNVLFYGDEGQRELAEASRGAVALALGVRITTVVEPLVSFTRAEDYHQKFRLRGERRVYDELAAYYATPTEFVDSTAGARLNGYLGGFGTLEQFSQERDLFGLSDEALAIVQEAVERTHASCSGD